MIGSTQEAMRLDPKERATLVGLLIDTLDADSDEGTEEAWPSVPRWMRHWSPWKLL